MRFVRRFLLICLLIAAAFGCGRIDEQRPESNGTQPQRPRDSVQLFFGNPSSANEADANNYLIIGEGSTISYNNARGTPNWVSWRTTRQDLGASRQRPDFRPDPRLPGWFARIGYYDYSGSGYDRGHMVPSADRFGTERLNEETFYLTNIVPQTSALNQHPWEKLESHARGQARRGFDVYQIAGVYGLKEMLKGKVAAPTNCWKIIAVVPSGRDEIDERTRLIAVDMPNEDGIEQGGWERFRTSIRAIEDKTGYDFFGFLPKEIQDRIEMRIEVRSN